MNPVISIFKSIPDEELRQAVIEIKEESESGKGLIRENGYVRKYAKQILETSKDKLPHLSKELFLTHTNTFNESAFHILQESAFRFLKYFPEKCDGCGEMTTMTRECKNCDNCGQ